MTAYNDEIIARFRTNGGRAEGFADCLVLIHSIGARSGEERVKPAMSVRDGDDWLVIASAAGASRNPAWYRNLVARPEATIEAIEGIFAVSQADRYPGSTISQRV